MMLCNFHFVIVYNIKCKMVGNDGLPTFLSHCIRDICLIAYYLCIFTQLILLNVVVLNVLFAVFCLQKRIAEIASPRMTQQIVMIRLKN